MPSRREFLNTVAVAGGAAALGSLAQTAFAQTKEGAKGGAPAPTPPAPGPYTLPPLPYPPGALEPHIDAQTMQIHHDKHHQAYVDKLNKALESQPDLAKLSVDDLLAGLDKVPTEIRTVVNNHGGGHSNHSIFWVTLAPTSDGGGGEPSGELAKGIAASFGDFASFKAAMSKAAIDRFGSGWAWLCRDKSNKLLVESFANQDSPICKGLVPLFGIDVWEHAYYLKYQNKRADYVAALWNVVNWKAVAGRLAGTK